MTPGGVEPAVSRLRVEWPTVSRQRRWEVRRGIEPRHFRFAIGFARQSCGPWWNTNGSGGRNRTFARLIQSQCGSPERARRTDPADGLEPSSTASKTVWPPRRAGAIRSAVRESNSPLWLGRPGPVPLDQPHEVPSAGVEPAPNRLKAGCSPLSYDGIGARRGDRTHLEQIKNLLPHQSAWRALLITSTIRFSKGPLPVGNADIVGRPRIELGDLRRAPGLQPGPSP